MDKNAIWKWLILVALVATSLMVVTPPKEKIRLGLDLRGGTSFVVKIDEERLRVDTRADNPTKSDKEIEGIVSKTLEGAQARALEVMRNRIDNLGISEPVIYPGKDNRITIQLPGVDKVKRDEARKSIESLAFLEFRMVHENNDELVARLFDEEKAPNGYRIARVGGQLVYKRNSSVAPDSIDRRDLSRFEAPSQHVLLLQEDTIEGETVYRPYYVRTRRVLTGSRLKDASVDYRAMSQPVVKLQFDAKGARTFGDVTSDYCPGGLKNPSTTTYRQLAIVLDGTLYSAPTIREPIRGGKAEISGSFSTQEALFLSNVLRAGALPAPVKIVEERFVAPSLGKDAIQSGIRAVLYGGVGVVVFMLVYYMAAGVVADIALALNLVLLPLGMILAAGFLGIFAKDATSAGPIQLPVLTLPGIAGILLTIGMAVDANVLIFERIREESRTGKRLWSAILAGYDRAFVTIVDANLTTLLTGIILFVFGSGPIRGFAVTLCAGIIVSMFTALVVTKLLFGLFAEKTKQKTLRMLQVIGETSIDFVAKRKIAAVISLVLIAASWAVFMGRYMSHPDSVLGVDFTGGVSVTMAFDPEVKPSLEDVRQKLTEAGLASPVIQFQQEPDERVDRYLMVKTSQEAVNDQKASAVILDALGSAFAESKFSVLQEDEVGPQIGDELKSRAVLSIVFALLGIIIYLSWRFELGFAIGAIVALAHDVLLTVGLFVLFGRQVSLPVVAALLTIVGYSVNDTIVVFDRIREDLRLNRSMGFHDIANLSINQTLSRTLLTSLTTLITVLMLLVFGGGAINNFALTLCIGVVVGTYSSVFVATPVVLAWYKNRKPEFAAK